LLLLDAVRRGELRLDDPAAKHLPGTASLPSRNGKVITLLNLAAHDAGFPPNPENLTKTDAKEAYEAYQVEDLYAFLSQYKLGSDPGEKFKYSNVGYIVLGQALQRRTGSDYEPLVIDRICRPLKMDDTRVVLTDDMKKRLAVGHSADGRRLTPLNMQVMAPAGALRSTARDLLKYLSANLGLIETELLEPMKTMHEIRHRGDPEYGNTALPWYDRAVYQPPDSEILGHGGGTFGFFTFIGFDRKCQRGVVVLSNQTVLNSSCVGLAILQGMPLTRGNATQLVREHLGIGVALSFDETAQQARISTVFRKSPAAEAGLTSGLLIRKINGTAVDGKRSNECFDLMRGPAGTNIRLDVVDSNGKETVIEVNKRKFLTST
jgi:CubicO group peptidase (beta-lactamase class C family)